MAAVHFLALFVRFRIAMELSDFFGGTFLGFG